MKPAHLRTLTLAAMVLGSACCSVSRAQDSTPLKEAVAAFNKKAAAYLAPHVDQKRLSEHQLPKPLTVDEVIAAIRGWKPESTETVEAAHAIFQAIMETKEAVHAGRHDLPASFVEHAVEAVDHARAAMRQLPYARITIESGVLHLNKAITIAKRTRSSRRVKMALRHTEAASSFWKTPKVTACRCRLRTWR